MDFDRIEGDDQIAGNLLIGRPGGNQPQDLDLALAERGFGLGHFKTSLTLIPHYYGMQSRYWQ
jgi:hypothetical protein